MNKLYSYIIIGLLAGLFSSCKKDKSPDDSGTVSVLQIYTDHNGIKWIATNKGLASYNNDSWTTFEYEDHLAGKNLLDIAYQSSQYGDELWFANTNGAIVASYDVDAVTSATTYTTGNSGILSNDVKTVSLDSFNCRWFGTSKGLSVFKGNQWYSQEYDGFFEDFPITDIGTDTSGWNYITTLGGGVSRQKFDVDAISGASEYDSVWTGVGSNFVNTVFIDGADQWYGSDRGVSLHTSFEAKQNWTRYRVGDGLISDNVFAIIKDAEGKMWFGTDSGISVFDGAAWISYTTASGLISDRITCMYPDTDGSIWIGTDAGVSHFKDNVWIGYSLSDLF